MQKCRAPSAWLWDSRVNIISIQPAEEGESVENVENWKITQIT
jgi:hypothetical protein